MKNDKKKEFLNTDYLAEVRRNNMYGVSYYNNLENEFAREENIDLEGEYYRQEDEAKKKTSKKGCDCGCHKSSEVSKKTKKNRK